MLSPLCPHCGSHRTIRPTPSSPALCNDCHRSFNERTLQEQNQPLITTEEQRLAYNTFKE